VTALTTSGAFAALVIGATAIAAGWQWGVLLIGFFVAAIQASAFRRAEKLQRAGDVIAKPGPRTAVQVIANGGAFAVAAVLFAVTDEPAARTFAAGALAAASADTWATELGLLSPATPRLISSGLRVPPGTSGGITLAGTGAAVLGALVVAVLAVIIGWSTAIAVAAAIGGMVGMLMDSVLGATIQDRRWCTVCARLTERRVHTCGNLTRRAGGIPAIGNDLVNFGATLFGGAVALLSARAL
jgi:uncharacterized protein (TIGR00297 family)